MVMLDIATRFEPAIKAKGRTLAVLGLLPGVVALPLAFLPGHKTSALTMAGVALLVSGVALIRAYGGRRRGRNLAAAGVTLGLLAAIGVLVAQATYAPGLPALPVTDPTAIPSAVAPKLADVTVKIGKFGVTGVPVAVTNSALRRSSVDLTVEAVSRNGRRLATDTVSVSGIEPGATSIATVFGGEAPALAKQLRHASFRLIETTKFSS